MATSSLAAFRENRAKFPLDELKQYDGQWVAFSADGRRIVASAATIAAVAERVRSTNERLAEVMIEHIGIESGEIEVGGAEQL
jgi:hypothetical protein